MCRCFAAEDGDAKRPNAEEGLGQMEFADPFLQRLVNSSIPEEKQIKDKLEEIADDATDVRPMIPYVYNLFHALPLLLAQPLLLCILTSSFKRLCSPLCLRIASIFSNSIGTPI